MLTLLRKLCRGVLAAKTLDVIHSDALSLNICSEDDSFFMVQVANVLVKKDRETAPSTRIYFIDTT